MIARERDAPGDLDVDQLLGRAATLRQRVGTIKVTTPAGASVAEVPLVVMDGVEQAGILGRAWDALRLWVK